MNWQLCITGLLSKGLKIEEIAAAIGVTPSAIREVIAGRTKSPRAEAAMALLDLCRAHSVEVPRSAPAAHGTAFMEEVATTAPGPVRKLA